MNNKSLTTLLLVTVLVSLLASSLGASLSETVTNGTEGSPSQNFEADFTYNVLRGHFSAAHTLQLSVPPSLYHYYERKAHFISGDSDYARFVTPEAFALVAENIRKTIDESQYSDEQFANAVLDFVQQIPYVKSTIKYPVEALVENSGDCDVLSLLAASIMKAGGLDVVLLYYKSINPSHMNLGVYLPYKPVYRSWWLEPAGFEYENKTYWMAESTSKEKWRVGDEPSLLQNSKPNVIALSKIEKSSPAIVASSLDGTLEPSSISATISLENSILEGEERSLTIIGEVNPALPGREVTMYVGRDGLAYEKFQTVSDEKGNYSFIWNFTLAGKYSITTSVGGTFVYAGSDSEKLTVFAGVYEPILEEYLPSGDPTVPIGSLVGQGPKYVLKGNVSGTGLSLSGDFMVISESDSGALIIEVKIPRTERAMYFPRTRQTLRVVINEEQIISVPIENNQLGFILRQNGYEDYSASVGVLEDQQISQIAKVLRESHAAYMNASDVATRNKWYKVEATISKNATNAKLYEMNNTLLQNIAVPDSQANGEMGILMSYPPNSILVFRNLKVTSLDQKVAPLPSERERSQADEIQSLAPYVAGAAFIAAIAVVASYVRRRKVTQNIGS